MKALLRESSFQPIVVMSCIIFKAAPKASNPSSGLSFARVLRFTGADPGTNKRPIVAARAVKVLTKWCSVGAIGNEARRSQPIRSDSR